MTTMRYERLSNADSLALPDETKVYNAEQIHDTAPIVRDENFEFDQFFFSDLSWQKVFKDSRDVERQKRVCTGIFILIIFALMILLIALFSGFVDVMLDFIGYQEKSGHGLVMIPNIRKRTLNVFYFNANNETANAEYANEIDNFLNHYAKKQEMLGQFLKKCTARQRSDESRLCTFDIKKRFHPDCSKLTNYGYDSGNPCMLFVFNDRLHWKPNMKSEMDYLPFVCRTENEYSKTEINITYYPSLPTGKHSGGFQMNLIPSEQITDENGNKVVETGGGILYNLPPMVMVKLSLQNALKLNENIFNDDFHDNLGPFTVKCQIEDNLERYQFDNINDFVGQTAISFDFVPYFPEIFD